MQPDNAVEESASDGGRGVRVAERNKMHILGEAIDHREDDRLAADLGQALDEVHRNIHPHLRRNVKGLQQPGGLQCLRLVALARAVGTYPVLEQGMIARHVEVGVEAMEHLLSTLMARRMSQEKGLVVKITMVWHEDAGAME